MADSGALLPALLLAYFAGRTIYHRSHEISASKEFVQTKAIALLRSIYWHPGAAANTPWISSSRPDRACRPSMRLLGFVQCQAAALNTKSSSSRLPKLIDYSQEGQALIIQQLITADTPKIVVNIGAHDGVTGSNSRGLLAEPVPAAFQHLFENSRKFAVWNAFAWPAVMPTERLKFFWVRIERMASSRVCRVSRKWSAISQIGQSKSPPGVCLVFWPSTVSQMISAFCSSTRKGWISRFCGAFDRHKHAHASSSLKS
jgi:hypothetical protein